MSVEVRHGDCIEVMASLEAESVHCVVTSPPYWGLRDYGVDGQIGLEPTPEAWCARLVEVFREVRRVLRPDGVLWLNIGDSYATGAGKVGDHPGGGNDGERARRCAPGTPLNRMPTAGLKPKDLIGQPWLLAFALRADGWWLRSEVIWNKPNPMPESVRDRPTKAHEQVFLLTKSASYYYDQEAVRERGQDWGPRDRTCTKHNGEAFRAAGQPPHRGLTNGDASAGRNARSVWTIATEPFSEAHFATFPTELARRCILAGTSAKGCCPACGVPWQRVVERMEWPGRAYSATKYDAATRAGPLPGSRQAYRAMGIEGPPAPTTTGWHPACACNAGEPIPCTVLDCFGGSGTTGLVADQLGRDAILIDLNPEYAEMARCRIQHARARRAIGPVDQPAAAMPGQGDMFAAT
ncbi:MAG: site-specific DNA-methyltransferase [Hyphomicrobiaceae bacterium]